MATSSIDSEFVIRDNKAFKRLVKVFEEAQKQPRIPNPITDKEVKDDLDNILEMLQCKYRQSTA
ncbi:MAG: hypothetical protein LBT79_06395 [Elusimicrobiota bacterium]|jgi:hypothetical protein|nr:hypothetical protein [Elusimicrobiota bacterium]